MENSASNEISVNLLPWSDHGLVVSSLKIHEELGGGLAHGSVELMYTNQNEPINILFKQCTGLLTIERLNSHSINIEIFVINRRYIRNYTILDFVCIYDKRFFTDLKSVEYKDITETLSSLYPGNTDIRCESDINNELPLIQYMETDQSFCTKLALSFKKNTIFAYGWEGFLLKDLKDGINSRGEKEEYDSESKIIKNAILIGGSGAEETGPTEITYDFMRFEKPWDPWGKPEEDSNLPDYSTFIPQNSKTLKYFDNYLTLGKDYYSLIENYLYNKQLMNSNLFATKQIIINDIPKFKLGDVITYKHLSEREIDFPYKTYLVKSNSLHILLSKGTNFGTGSNIKWTSTLLSLVDAFGELLPETDITNKIYEG